MTLGCALVVSAAGAAGQTLPERADAGLEMGTLVVLSGSAAEALLVDPTRNRIVARFRTGPDPREVALSPDGRFAYVSSYGWQPGAGAGAPARSAEEPGEGPRAVDLRTDVSPAKRGLTVLDLAGRRVHAVFQPGDYLNLGSVTLGPAGRRLWVTTEGEGGIAELDAATGEVKMLWKTAAGRAGSLAVSDDERQVFVSLPASDGIVLVDRVTVVPTRIATGPGPTGLALAPRRSELWVTNSGDHTISVIDTRRRREIERFSAGGREPVRIAFHEGRNEAWVSNRGSRSLTVLDVASAAVMADIALPGEPRSVTFSSDGRRAYVSSPKSGRVFAIDVRTREVVESLDVGSRPGGLVWTSHAP